MVTSAVDEPSESALTPALNQMVRLARIWLLLNPVWFQLSTPPGSATWVNDILASSVGATLATVRVRVAWALGAPSPSVTTSLTVYTPLSAGVNEKFGTPDG